MVKVMEKFEITLEAALRSTQVIRANLDIYKYCCLYFFYNRYV